MKRVAIIILLTAVYSMSYGQVANDSISMKKVFGGYQFYQDNKRLNLQQLIETMKHNDQAYQQIKSAQGTNTIASIVGGVGGFMLGWPLGAAVAGGDPNWTMAGIGAGLIVVSIPLTQSVNKKAKLAVDTYNSGLQASSFWDRSELKLASTGNGFGLTLNF